MLLDPHVSEFIDIDARRLQQILYNLLGNAVKFSKDGGVVELGASVCSLQNNSPTSSSTSKILRFAVKDYGKGIETKDFENIFKPFLQASTGLDIVHEGTGLGLAITKRLAEAMHGSSSVDSEFGKWTEFRVDFPFHDGSFCRCPSSIRKTLRGSNFSRRPQCRTLQQIDNNAGTAQVER
jgi:signal transduction histidine kinase